MGEQRDCCGRGGDGAPGRCQQLRITLNLLPAPQALLVPPITMKQLVSAIARKANRHLLPCQARQGHRGHLGVIRKRFGINLRDLVRQTRATPESAQCQVVCWVPRCLAIFSARPDSS